MKTHSETVGRQTAPVTHLFWVLAAGVLGWMTSLIFGNVLHMDRHWFVGVYCAIVTSFLAVYFHRCQVNIVDQFKQHVRLGLLGAGVFSILMINGVIRQARSTPPAGSELASAVLWLGLVYGLVDAMLLTVMPALATFRLHEMTDRSERKAWRMFRAASAMAASLFITAAYHWGYAEFQGETIVQPLVGNGIITFGYLLTRNPLTPIIAHVAMHIAAVFWGIDTTVQLPPHY